MTIRTACKLLKFRTNAGVDCAKQAFEYLRRARESKYASSRLFYVREARRWWKYARNWEVAA